MKLYQLSEAFTFGKYKGYTVQEVIDLDIQYITWCIEKIPDFALANSAKEYYNKQLRLKNLGARK